MIRLALILVIVLQAIPDNSRTMTAAIFDNGVANHKNAALLRK